MSESESNKPVDAVPDFRQLDWGADVAAEGRRLVELALAEDVGQFEDWTTVATIQQTQHGAAQVVTRQAGTIAGLSLVPVVFEVGETQLSWQPKCADGDTVAAGQALGEIRGPARQLLTTERVLLNLIGRLSGIATLTAKFVAAAEGRAQVYDTRKTTPGWRLSEKYAVRCGGGRNHRTGLFDAILIKDNHLALFREATGGDAAACLNTAMEFVTTHALTAHNTIGTTATGKDSGEAATAERPNPTPRMVIEIEVDTLNQLESVLPLSPDVVLLDNMSNEQLRRAVQLRDNVSPRTQLEASGGVNLGTIGAIAATGIDRISIGALTHSAIALDVGLDWNASN